MTCTTGEVLAVNASKSAVVTAKYTVGGILFTIPSCLAGLLFPPFTDAATAKASGGGAASAVSVSTSTEFRWCT